MEQSTGILEKERQREQEEDAKQALLGHVLAHATYEALILLTAGQYVLYQRKQNGIVCKGISSQSMRAAFVQEPVDSGWLPNGVVRCGSGARGAFFVKFIPPGRQHPHFTVVGSTGIETIVCPLPALVFAGVESTYYIWALRTEQYDPSARLFHAPFPNIYADGRICFGQNAVPLVSAPTLEATWQVFLTSLFNGDLATGKSQAQQHDVREQLRAVTTADRYPVKDLLPFSRESFRSDHWVQTLDDAVNCYLLKKEKE